MEERRDPVKRGRIKDKASIVMDIRRIRVWMIAAMAVLPSVSLSQRSGVAQEQTRAHDKGAQFEREGRIEEALEEYKQYLALHPLDVPVARRFLGLLFREERFEELVKAYDDLHAEVQGQRGLTELAARAYLRIGQEDKGIKVLHSIITREGGSLNSYRHVGNTLLSLGYIDEAREIFQKGRRRWGEHVFARELYHCFIRIQDVKRAFRELLYLSLGEEASGEWVKRELNMLINKDGSLLRYLESIARDEPAYARVAGELFLEHGEMALAKEFFLPVLDTGSLLAFGSLCMGKGYLQEAEEVLERIIDEGEGGSIEEQAYLLLAQTFRKAGRVEDGLKMLEHLIREGSVFCDSAAVLKAEMLLYDAKRYEEAMLLLEQLREKDKNIIHRDRFLTLTFTGYLRVGDLAGAERLVSTCVTPLSFFFSGEVHFFRDSYVESKDSYSRAVARGLDRDFANDALERIMVMETLQSKPALLALVTDIELAMARALHEEAIELIDGGFDSFSEKEERAVLLYCKARAHSEMGLVNEAVASFTNVADESPASGFAPKALYHASMLYRDEIGDPAMARELLRRIIFDYPASVEAELSRSELQVL
jgi:tetratricopeptide (TPR) repeat protein